MRRKVLIFECTWRGESPASDCEYEDIQHYLEDALPVETEKIVTDGKGVNVIFDYDTSVSTIRKKMSEMIRPYTSDRLLETRVFVIADPFVSLVSLPYLRNVFPKAIFIGYDGTIDKLVAGAQEVVILAPKMARKNEAYQMMKASCGNIATREPDYREWVSALKYNFVSSHFLDDFKAGSKVVVIHPGLIFKQSRLERAIDWRGEVIDVRKLMVDELRVACGLTKWV